MYLHQYFDDHNSVRLKNSAQDVYAYDHALKFSILQENPWLKQTETPTANFICKLLSSWWYNLSCVI